MTDESSSPAGEPAKAKRQTSRLKVAGIAGAAVLLIAFVAVVLLSPEDKGFVWLNPTQFTQSTKPGRFDVIKWKVIRWTAPIWSRFRKPSPQIWVQGKLLLIRDGGIERLGMGTAGTTNADGLCAWILQPNESQLFRAQIKTNPAVIIGNESAIVTGSGGQASVFNMNSGIPGTPNTGTKIDVLPKYSAGWIKLLLNVSATGRMMSNTTTLSVQTNLDAACQVKVPDGGGLVLSKRLSSNGTNYFMLISATAMDGKGNPVRKVK
jgi:hypothetical protein